jgi:hypothetical protein
VVVPLAPGVGPALEKENLSIVCNHLMTKLTFSGSNFDLANAGLGSGIAQGK